MTKTGKPKSATDATSKVESLNLHAQTPKPQGTPSKKRVAAEDLDQIVRRAAELQHKGGAANAQMLSEDEVIEIGRQVGLQASLIRRAMAEVRADSLTSGQPPEPRLFNYLTGTTRVEVRRVVAGEPRLIQRQLELSLRDQEKLKPVRQRAMRSIWEPSGGLMGKMERALDFYGKKSALANASQVDLAVAELEPDWTLVTLGAEFANERNEFLCTAVSLVGSAMLVAGVFTGLVFSLGLFWGFIATLLTGGIGTVVATSWMRTAMGKRRARGELILESLLDQVDPQP